MENLIAINIAVPEGISGRCCAGCIFVHLQHWLKLMGVLTSFIYDEQKGQLSVPLCLLMEK